MMVAVPTISDASGLVRSERSVQGTRPSTPANTEDGRRRPKVAVRQDDCGRRGQGTALVTLRPPMRAMTSVSGLSSSGRAATPKRSPNASIIGDRRTETVASLFVVTVALSMAGTPRRRIKGGVPSLCPAQMFATLSP